MPRPRSNESIEPYEQPAERLPLRWAVIIALSVAAAVPAGAVGGLAAGIGAFFVVALALHAMVA
jgi:hypothetical protein